LIILGHSLTAEAQSLDKRHQIELRMGFWNQVATARTEVHGADVTTSVESNGTVGSLSYGHWLQEGLALNLGVAGLAADIEHRSSSSGTSTETGVVSYIFIGLKHYFPKSTHSSSVRPFAGISLGPYIGSQTETEVGTVVTVESRTEGAIGGHLSGGVDFLLGRYFMTGLAIGYNLMADFGNPIGGSKNFSGPTFSIALSLLLGGGAK
jgi:hypothetical protein